MHRLHRKTCRPGRDREVVYDPRVIPALPSRHSRLSIRSTLTIARLTPASGGRRCESVCSAVHRRTMPFELVWNQPSLSLWKVCSTLPSRFRNLMMHSSFLMDSPYRVSVVSGRQNTAGSGRAQEDSLTGPELTGIAKRSAGPLSGSFSDQMYCLTRPQYSAYSRPNTFRRWFSSARTISWWTAITTTNHLAPCVPLF
jgi:hypothetical protein